MRRYTWLAAIILALSTGCVPLMVGPNNFTPAGEIRAGNAQFTASLELSPVLALPSLTPKTELSIDNGRPVPWLSQDLSFQYGVSDRLQLGAELKWGSLLPFIIPLPIGVGAGARYTFFRQPEAPLSLDGMLDLYGERSAQSVSVNSTRTEMSATALGGRVGAVVSYRPTTFLAFSAAPYARAFALRASAQEDQQQETSSENVVFGAGVSFSLELKTGSLVIAMAVALEGVGTADKGFQAFAPSPGFSIGTRW